MAKQPKFEFELEALLTLLAAEKKDVEIRIRRLDGKLKRAQVNHKRRLQRVADIEQRIRESTTRLVSRPDERITGEMIRERTRVLGALRLDLSWHRRKAERRADTVRLFRSQMRAQEARRKEIQAEIDELDRQKEVGLRAFKRGIERKEERERDEDQMQRFHRDDPQ